MAAISSGQNYLAMWSVVCSIERAATVDIVRLREVAIRELDATGLVQVYTGSNQTYVQQHDIDNLLSEDYKQIDFVCRFSATVNSDTAILDNAYSYAWNTVAGRPMLPSGDPTNGGILFAACSQGLTRERQGAGTSFQTLRDVHPYKQLCSSFRPIADPNSGNVVSSGSVIDRLSSNRISSSTNPQTIGTNPNNSTDFRSLASEAGNDVTRTINGIFGANHNAGEGMSTNDIKFFAYAGLGLVALVAFSKIIGQVKGSFK